MLHRLCALKKTWKRWTGSVLCVCLRWNSIQICFIAVLLLFVCVNSENVCISILYGVWVFFIIGTLLFVLIMKMVYWCIILSLSLTVKSLGILLSSTLSMENFISQTAKSCYYQLHWISSVWKHLSTKATVKLSPHSFFHTSTTAVLSFLAGLLPLSIDFIAYRTVLLASYWKNMKLITSHLFQFLHWLPIQQRIQYKTNTLCYKCIMGTALSYSCDFLQLYTPVLSAPLLILLASRFLSPDSLLLVPTLFCFQFIYMEWPSPSSWTETLSGLIQMEPENISFPKTVDVPCFLICAAVLIHLRSLIAACFKLCKLSCL